MAEEVSASTSVVVDSRFIVVVAVVVGDTFAVAEVVVAVVRAAVIVFDAVDVASVG